jgi:hypothetical protein
MKRIKQDRIYVLLTRMARAMKINVSSVYKWEKDKHFEAIWVGNQKMVLRRDVINILHNWRRTCTPTEAATRIGTKRGTIFGYMDRGAIDYIKMFGYRRVLLSSIPRGKEYFANTEKRLHDASSNVGKHGGGHRWDREEALDTWETKKIPREMGNEGLITRRKAAKILGISLVELSTLPIRGKEIDGLRFYFSHSVNVYKTQRRAKKLRIPNAR